MRSFLTILFLLLLQLRPENICAQKFRNGVDGIGFFAGASNYFGDLAPEIVWKESHPSFGLIYKHEYGPYFSSRYQFTYGAISGDDANFAANSYRNIRFRSNIFELACIGEFNFKPFGMNANMQEQKSSTYVFGGFSMFMFNPVVTLPGGDDLELRDIGTEGQKLNRKHTYAQIQPALILGIGYKFNVRKKADISFECGFRKTFTDYLDDTKGDYVDYKAIVAKQGSGAGDYSHPETLNRNPPIAAGSMRGDPNLKDWYFMIGFTIIFKNVIGDPCFKY